jgi:ankyrin repeat protein
VYRYDSDRGLEFPSPALNESHCFYWNFGHFVGVTPLLTATQTRETEMMKILLKEGANPNAPSTLSLVDKGLMNIRPLHFAGISGDTERAKLLIDYGAGLNLTNEEGQAPLFYVCRRGDVEMMKLLLKYGANPALTAKGVGPLDWILQSPGLLKAYEGGRPEGGYDLSLT